MKKYTYMVELVTSSDLVIDHFWMHRTFRNKWLAILTAKLLSQFIPFREYATTIILVQLTRGHKKEAVKRQVLDAYRLRSTKDT